MAGFKGRFIQDATKSAARLGKRNLPSFYLPSFHIDHRKEQHCQHRVNIEDADLLLIDI